MILYAFHLAVEGGTLCTLAFLGYIPQDKTHPGSTVSVNFVGC